MISPRDALLTASNRLSLGGRANGGAKATEPAEAGIAAPAEQGGHRPKLVLASASPRRLGLLEQAGITPDALRPASISEMPKRGEAPRALVRRLARAKAEKIQEALKTEPAFANSFILAADTVVAVGKRILGKAEKEEDAIRALELLSGRAHRVYTAVSLINPKGGHRQRVVETRVRFKRLSREEIEAYLATGEWKGKAGAYAVQGIAGSFVVKLVGSYTNVVGLPLYESLGMLAGDGFPITLFWLNRVEVETA